MTEVTLRTIGHIQSSLRERKNAPRQGAEGAPDAWLDVLPAFAAGLRGMSAGDEVLIVTGCTRANVMCSRCTRAAIDRTC